MSEFNIEVQGGSSVRLPTAGKYCEKDIIVTASGGSGSGTEELENLIDESGVLDSTDGTVTEKVEQLIDFAEWRNFIQERIYYFAEKKQRINLFDYMQLESEKINCFDYSRNSSFSDTFRNNDVITELNIDTSNATTISYMIANCSNLEKVVLPTTKNVTNYNTAFGGNPKLKHIETLDFSGASNINNPFLNSNAIETIKIVPETIKVSIKITSPVLSGESIQSTFGGLNSEVTGQTLTLSHNAVKKAFETSEGSNDGDTSAVWSELVASKPNWTITLS